MLRRVFAKQADIIELYRDILPLLIPATATALATTAKEEEEED